MENLVVLSSLYPYSRQKEFLEDEIVYWAKKCKNIFVLTENLDCHPQWGIPSNCKIVKVRRKKIEILPFMMAICGMFSLAVFREVYFAVKKLNVHSYSDIFRNIFVYRYYLVIYTRAIKKMGLGEDTRYLSYWMDHKAYALSELTRKQIIGGFFSRTHGFDCFIERGYLPFRREILSNATRVFPISEKGKKSISEKLLIYANRMDDSFIQTIRLGTNKVYAGFYEKKNESGTLIVSCSNVNEIKRLDLIIMSLSLLVDTPIHWVHFGDGPLIEEMKALAKKDLPSNISYEFKGFTPNIEIQNYYRNNFVDLFINLSDHEGIPVSIMEACAYGIPILARDVGGISEIVSEDNGCLCYTDDINIISKEIKKIVSSKSDQLRYNSYRMYKNFYSIKENGEKMIEEMIKSSETKV